MGSLMSPKSDGSKDDSEAEHSAEIKGLYEKFYESRRRENGRCPDGDDTSPLDFNMFQDDGHDYVALRLNTARISDHQKQTLRDAPEQMRQKLEALKKDGQKAKLITR